MDEFKIDIIAYSSQNGEFVEVKSNENMQI